MKKHIIASVAMLLVTAMLLGGCGAKTTQDDTNAMQEANKLDVNYQDDTSVTNQGEDAPEITLKAGSKPYRSEGHWESVEEGKQVYDLKVTTFNVGNWYHGVCNLDIYGAQKSIHPGILPEYVIGAYNAWMNAFPKYDSDLICTQEMKPIFMVDSQKDITLTAESVLSQYFKQVESFEGATRNGNLPMWMGMLVPNSSGYSLKNITTGHVCANLPAYSRAYMKGYVTVKGHDIAVFCVHLQPSSSGLGDASIRRQAYAEIIEMACKEEYAIVMGDMNSDDDGLAEFKVMTDAGFNMANGGEFGAFNTYEYGNDTDDMHAIDNIFTTNNIEIGYVECEKSLVGGSDHYPLSAYLKIKDEAHTCGNPYQAGADGYMEGWYEP